jgi:hypothetical protein
MSVDAVRGMETVETSFMQVKYTQKSPERQDSALQVKTDFATFFRLPGGSHSRLIIEGCFAWPHRKNS